jgi:hypothetical protein
MSTPPSEPHCEKWQLNLRKFTIPESPRGLQLQRLMNDKMNVITDQVIPENIIRTLLHYHLTENSTQVRPLLRRNMQTGVPLILKKGDCCILSDRSDNRRKSSEHKQVYPTSPAESSSHE